MSKNMVELVAAAIESRLEGVIAEAVQNMGDTGPYPNDWREAARAAIEAMREPTEAMRQAGYVESAFRTPEAFSAARLDFAPKEAWRAMITAALKP